MTSRRPIESREDPRDSWPGAEGGGVRRLGGQYILQAVHDTLTHHFKKMILLVYDWKIA